jgi:hypothetical protein
MGNHHTVVNKINCSARMNVYIISNTKHSLFFSVHRIATSGTDGPCFVLWVLAVWQHNIATE